MGKTTPSTLRVTVAAILVLVLVGCSTTAKLGENDVLYTGVKKLKYNVADSVTVAS